jgi:hypothetical protein
MRTGELNSEFLPIAKSAQLVFEQANIQAPRFGCAGGHVWPVVRVESRSSDRHVVGARQQTCQRALTLLGTGGLVNHFCVLVGSLNLSIFDSLASESTEVPVIVPPLCAHAPVEHSSAIPHKGSIRFMM